MIIQIISEVVCTTTTSYLRLKINRPCADSPAQCQGTSSVEISNRCQSDPSQIRTDRGPYIPQNVVPDSVGHKEVPL